MPYKDKEKERARRRLKQAEYRAKHKDDPEYKRKNRETVARWRAADPERARQSRRRSVRKTVLNFLDTDHWKWEDVEGYDGFTTNTEVHHRREGIGYTRAQLKEQGQYYNCRADELICVTKAEHQHIHYEINKFFGRHNLRNQ